MKSLRFLTIGLAMTLAVLALAASARAQHDEELAACQRAGDAGLRILERSNRKFDAGLSDLQDAVIGVTEVCGTTTPSWLDAALTDLANCEAACTAAFNVCSNQIPCGFFCQLGCSLERLECNTGCNAVFAARAADCTINKP